MGISRKLKDKVSMLSDSDRNRLVRMGWEDRTSFDAIYEQFGLTMGEFIKFMRTELDRSAFERWRKRANNRGHLKQEKKRPFVEGRFKCSRQRADGSTKGWK